MKFSDHAIEGDLDDIIFNFVLISLLYRLA
jgi:hypothetical protein